MRGENYRHLPADALNLVGRFLANYNVIWQPQGKIGSIVVWSTLLIKDNTYSPGVVLSVLLFSNIGSIMAAIETKGLGLHWVRSRIFC